MEKTLLCLGFTVYAQIIEGPGDVDTGETEIDFREDFAGMASSPRLVSLGKPTVSLVDTVRELLSFDSQIAQARHQLGPARSP